MRVKRNENMIDAEEYALFSLTHKQYKFCLVMLETFNASEAAYNSYSVKDRKSAKVIGCRLLKNEAVIGFLKRAIHGSGLQHDELAAALKRGLNAKRTYTYKGELIESKLPDGITQLKAAKLVHEALFR